MKDKKINPLDQFEANQKLLDEVKDLFEFAPPSKLRQSIETIFFLYFTSNEDIELQNQKELISHVYYLINFLNEVEKI